MYVGEEVLARLLEENPAVVAAVLAALEERRKAVELAQEEDRLRRETEYLVRETETAKRAQEEAAWPVALARTRVQATRAAFVAETYTLLEQHVFILSGVDGYVPRREDYVDELVLRDLTEHLALTWAEVYFQLLFLPSILNCCI